MKSYIGNSLFYRIIIWFSSVYHYSFLNKSFTTLGIWSSNSAICNWFIRYFDKKSFAENSVFYRVLSLTGKKLDNVAGRLHNTLSLVISSSKAKAVFDTLKAEANSSLNTLIITVLFTFLAGFVLATTVLGGWNTTKLLYIIFVGIVALFSIVPTKSWKCWIVNSRIYKILYYIWE